MSMDALKNIVSNVPEWLKRLDQLSGEIDQRQVELATFSDAASATRSLKNKGSTESLKPKDDGPAFAMSVDTAPMAGVDPMPKPISVERTGAVTPPGQQRQQPQPVSPGSGTPSALQRQTQQAMLVARRRARVEVRRRHRTESMISAEGAPSKYRTRSMIIVYYDAYVQNFFEELVKFVSASRNLMRKAKMAAKVAQIRRLAEIEMPDAEDDETPSDLPNLSVGRFLTTRTMRPGLPSFAMAGGRGILGDQAPDAYDELDKALEYVQSMAEHAAHQFLRDGDCQDEIANVQRRLAETKELAAKEIDRVMRDEPSLANETGDLGKVRTHRPTTMRREPTPKRELAPASPVPEKEAQSPTETPAPVSGAILVADPDVAKPLPGPPAGMEILEVDPNLVADDDEGFEEPLPKLVYKSTRRLRSRN